VDFEEILTYSRAKFPRDTERFGNAILDLIDLLKSFPYIGAPVAGGVHGVRKLVHTPILIYYSVDEGNNFVEILHLWHAQRDLAP
jgi:plasmid stabilization system protein ParE